MNKQAKLDIIYNFMKKNNRSSIGYGDQDLLIELYSLIGGKSVKNASKNMMDFLSKQTNMFKQNNIHIESIGYVRNFTLLKQPSPTKE